MDQVSGHTTDRLRVGAVCYLNTKPLVYRLAESAPQIEVVFDLPSRLADGLAAGELDVALIPSIELARNPGYTIVSDACIACRGPVLSVKLLSRRPISEIRTLALDEGSRTSIVLAQILLRERYGLQPATIPLPIGVPVEQSAADAIVLIGDRAIRQPTADFVEQWDLGEEWCRWSGLPFVFSAWVGRQGRSRSKLPLGPEVGYIKRSADVPPGWQEDEQSTGTRIRYIGAAFDVPYVSSPESSRNRSKTPANDVNRSGDDLAVADAVLRAARDAGVAHLEEIARHEAVAVGLSYQQTLRYLRDHLHFFLGIQERRGLQQFFRHAARLGAAPDGAERVVDDCEMVG